MYWNDAPAEHRPLPRSFSKTGYSKQDLRWTDSILALAGYGPVVLHAELGLFAVFGLCAADLPD